MLKNILHILVKVKYSKSRSDKLVTKLLQFLLGKITFQKALPQISFIWSDWVVKGEGTC